MQDPLNEVEEVKEPPQLRFLRQLVTVLTAVMIGGVVLIIALLVIRLNDKPDLLPDQITLPNGSEARAMTQGEDWYAIVTDQNQILIFDRLSGKLRQTIDVKTEN